MKLKIMSTFEALRQDRICTPANCAPVSCAPANCAPADLQSAGFTVQQIKNPLEQSESPADADLQSASSRATQTLLLPSGIDTLR